MDNSSEEHRRKLMLATSASVLPALPASLFKNGDVSPGEWFFIACVAYALSRFMGMLLLKISLNLQLSDAESRIKKNPELCENIKTVTVDRETSELSIKWMITRYQFYGYISLYCVWALLK